MRALTLVLSFAQALRPRLALLVGMALLFSGCATQGLWESDYGRLHKAAKPTNLAVHIDEQASKQLIAYDETKSFSRTPERHAYWLETNAVSKPVFYRPAFVSVLSTNGLVQAPVGEVPIAKGWSVVPLPGANSYSLYFDGVKQNEFHLPKYHDAGGTLMKLSLTSLTLTADVVVDTTIGALTVATVGGFAYVCVNAGVNPFDAAWSLARGFWEAK